MPIKDPGQDAMELRATLNAAIKKFEAANPDFIITNLVDVRRHWLEKKEFVGVEFSIEINADLTLHVQYRTK